MEDACSHTTSPFLLLAKCMLTDQAFNLECLVIPMNVCGDPPHYIHILPQHLSTSAALKICVVVVYVSCFTPLDCIVDCSLSNHLDLS